MAENSIAKTGNYRQLELSFLEPETRIIIKQLFDEFWEEVKRNNQFYPSVAQADRMIR